MSYWKGFLSSPSLPSDLSNLEFRGFTIFNATLARIYHVRTFKNHISIANGKILTSLIIGLTLLILKSKEIQFLQFIIQKLNPTLTEYIHQLHNLNLEKLYHKRITK